MPFRLKGKIPASTLIGPGTFIKEKNAAFPARQVTLAFGALRPWPESSQTGFAWNGNSWLQTQFRPCHRLQACLALFGQAREDHRNVITGVFVAGAGNDHPGALEPAVVARR